MRFNQTLRIFGGSLLAAMLMFAATPSVASAAPSAAVATASHGATAAFLDPIPRPPWVAVATRFYVLAECEATGRAYVNGGAARDWTCRYTSSRYYLLYILPR